MGVRSVGPRRILEVAAYRALDVREHLYLRRHPSVTVGADSSRRHLSTVSRLGPADAAAAVAPLRSVTDGGLYVYPPGDVHVTILNLDGARARQRDDVIAERAGDVLRSSPPLRLRCGGYGLSRASMFVRVHDVDGGLWRLRTRLAKAFDLKPALPSRALGFVNVARFVSADAASVRGMVRTLPPIDDAITLEAAEVVVTDRLLSAGATSVLCRVELDN
jgi:hypothetical protein